MLEWLIVVGAKYLIALPIIAVAGYLFLFPRSRKQLGFLVVSLAVAAYMFDRIAGLFYSHVQPFVTNGTAPLIPHAVDNSFPSDHMALAASLAIALFFYKRWLGIALFGVALLIGLARVAAGLHYWSDVIAAAVLGAAATLLCRFILQKFIFRSRTQENLLH